MKSNEATTFINHCIGNGLADRTIQNYEQTLHIWEEWQEKQGKQYSDLTIDDLEQYKSYLATEWQGKSKGKKPSASTIKQHGVITKIFLKYLQKRGKIPQTIALNEISNHRVKKKAVQIFERDDIDMMMRSIKGNDIESARNRAIFSLLYATGVRQSELVALNKTEIERAIEQGREEATIAIVGKSKEPRYLVVGGAPFAYIKRYLKLRQQEYDTNPALFIAHGRRFKGERLKKGGVGDVMRKISKTSGYKVSTHSLRHACAQELIRSGANIKHVQQILGHQSINTTSVYSNVSQADSDVFLRRIQER